MCNCNRPVCNNCNKLVPHAHAALIKQWADGAPIEKEIEPGRWLLCANPQWNAATNYRVKSIPKPLWEVCKEGFYSASAVKCPMSNEHWQRAAEAVIKAYNEGSR